MIRTQISLEEETYRAVKEEAARQGVSVAELVRRALAAMLGSSGDRQQPWMRYAGALSSGDPNASRSVNDVVYGRPRP